jgi:hypothetical protein
VEILGGSSADDLRVLTEGSTQIRISSWYASTEQGYLLASRLDSLVLAGEGGADRFYLAGNLHQAEVAEVSVNLGNDASADAVQIVLTSDADVLKLSSLTQDGSLRMTATWTGHGVFNLLGADPADGDSLSLYGGEGDDLLCALAVSQVPFSRISFYGEGGNDRIIGTPIGDTVDGGPGNDTLSGLGGLDTFQDAGGYDTLIEAGARDFGLYGNLLVEGVANVTGRGELRRLASFGSAVAENIGGIFEEAQLRGSSSGNVFAIGAAAGLLSVNGANLAVTARTGLVKLNGVGGDDEYLVELRGLDGARVEVTEENLYSNGVLVEAAGGSDALVIRASDLAESGTAAAAGGWTTFTLQTPGLAASVVATTSQIESTALYLLGADDTLALLSLGLNTTIGCGTGNDTVNVGSLAPAAAGVVDGIAALLTVNGQDGSDTLNVDDSGDANDNVGTISASAIGGLDMAGSISYTLFESLNLWLGAGSDILTVSSTHAGSSWIAAGAGADTVNLRTIAGATTVLAGAGNDTVNVGSLAAAAGGVVDGISALLVLDGQQGYDALNVDDRGDTNGNSGVLTASTISGLDMAGSISYALFETLTLGLGGGADLFTIESTHAGTTLLNAGPGADTIHIHSIAGHTRAEGGSGADHLLVNVDGENGVGALLELDGQAGADLYTIYLAGQPFDNLTPVSIVTVDDTGGDAGADFLEVFGPDDALRQDNFLLRAERTASRWASCSSPRASGPW